MLPLLVIVGPTSSGKTALSLYLAKHFPIEVISADSRQVYREIVVGTNKVTPRTKVIYRGEYADLVPNAQKDIGFIPDIKNLVKEIGWWSKKGGLGVAVKPSQMTPHFLIDISSLKENYTLGHFAKDAHRITSNIVRDRKIPCVVGGTGQYIKSIIDGWFGLDIDVSEYPQVEKEKDLFKKLKKIDPEYSKRVDPNNVRRITRALAVYEKTGEKFSELQKRRRNPWAKPFIIGLEWNREELYSRIDSAVEERFKKGIVDEVKSLIDSGVDESRIRSLGLSYKWALEVANGQIAEDEAIEKAQFDEHSFVRRQMTWFRKIKGVYWVKCGKVVK